MMSVRDLVILLLGAVLGVLAQQSYDWLIGHYRHLSADRRADRLRGRNARSALFSQTMRFYQRKGLCDSLYTPGDLGGNKQIPILWGDLTIPRTVDPYRDGLFYLETNRSNFPVNQKLIRRSVLAGANIFDGEILYVKKVDVETDTIKRVELGSCGFFAFASLSLQLQEALRSRWRVILSMNGTSRHSGPQFHNRFNLKYSDVHVFRSSKMAVKFLLRWHTAPRRL
jgi:hypothetical protein